MRWKTAACWILAGATALPCLAADAASPKFVREWGTHGKGSGEFDFPIGIAQIPGGRSEEHTSELPVTL